MLAELAPGTLPQWGTFLGVIAGLIGLATVFVKGIPQRTKATSDAKQADNADYAAQIRNFRDEVHGYRNELQALQGRLNRAESASRLRADRITNMTFIIRLLISELLRLDPDSIIVQQAEALLKQMEDGEHPPMGAAETADRAVAKAQDTVKAAKATVAELASERDDQ